MGWKCTPQVTGLVRGEPKKGQKHRNNAKMICLEAGQERVSCSETLDRDRSKNNVYTYEKSGYKLYKSMIEEADSYRQTYRKRNGELGERGLRKDAVVGFAVILNPPGEVCKNWDDDTYQEFYEDSWEVLKKIRPEVFSDDNVRMVAEHKDEGMKINTHLFTNHSHILGIPKDSDGKYCGNLIDAKLMVDINENYPRMMRELGWDMDDLDCTDYSEWRGRNCSKSGGKSTNDYIADKLREKIAEAEKMIADVQELQKSMDERENDLNMRENDLRIKVKMQAKRDADFQHREDALEAQKLALDKRESAVKRREILVTSEENTERIKSSGNKNRPMPTIKGFE